MFKKQIRLYMLSAAAVAFVSPPAAGEPKAKASAELSTYKVVDKIAGPDGGGWDLSNVDPKTRRLYVSRPYGIMMIDLDTKKVTDKFAEGAGVHGILPVPRAHMIVSANEDTNSAMLFEEETGKTVASVPVGKHPDSVTYDPKSRLVTVINQDGGDATLVDVKKRAAVGTIPIGGQRIEFSVTDGHGLVYVNVDGVDNVEDKSEIAVLDIAGRKTARRIALPGCARPSGLAYDAADGLLITSCRNNVAKVIEAKTGREVGSVPIGPGPDCVMFDATRHLAFVPTGGDGKLTLIPITSGKDKGVGEVTTVPTQVLARLGALDPKTGRLYLPTAEAKPTPDPGQRRTLIPGSFAILIVAPN
jgi:DNA-binding beta-propeller fold protein YncE